MFNLKFTIYNDAFFPTNGNEIARILRDLTDRVDDSDLDGVDWAVKDVNGNTIGRLEIDKN